MGGRIAGIAAFLAVAALAASRAAGPPAEGEKAEPDVGEVAVAVESGRVLVSFTLAGAFDDAFRARLESGLPTELAFAVELVRDRRRWLDKRVRSARLEVVAMYNALTRDYLVNTKVDGRLMESRVVHDLATLESTMTRVSRLPFFAIEPDDVGQRMRVRVQAELGTRTVFFFVPTTRATAWADSARFRPETAAPTSDG